MQMSYVEGKKKSANSKAHDTGLLSRHETKRKEKNSQFLLSQSPLLLLFLHLFHSHLNAHRRSKHAPTLLDERSLLLEFGKEASSEESFGFEEGGSFGDVDGSDRVEELCSREIRRKRAR